MNRTALDWEFKFSTEGWSNVFLHFLSIGILFHIIGVVVLILTLKTNGFLIISWILIFMLPFNASLVVPAKTWIKEVTVLNGSVTIDYYRYNTPFSISKEIAAVQVKKLWFLPAGRHGHGLEIRIKDKDKEVAVRQYSAFGWNTEALKDLQRIIEEQQKLIS